MTALGKVFTGLVFFLSILFFTFAVMVNASHVDTKTLASDLKNKANAAESRNRQLEEVQKVYRAELEAEIASRSAALAALQTQLEAVEYELAQEEIKADDARKALILAAQTNEATQQDLVKEEQSIASLREQIATTKASRDEKLKQLLQIKNEYHQLQGAYQSLAARAEDLGL